MAYLVLWKATSASALTVTDLNWGTVRPHSSADLRFRVHNDSVYYTAGNVVVSVEDPASGTSVAPNHLLSLDGQLFTATINIGDLHPTATSRIFTLRRVTRSSAPLGVGGFKLVARADSWE